MKSTKINCLPCSLISIFIVLTLHSSFGHALDCSPDQLESYVHIAQPGEVANEFSQALDYKTVEECEAANKIVQERENKEKKADDTIRAKYKASGQTPYEKCVCNFNGCLGKKDFHCGYATKCLATTAQDYQNALNNHLAIYIISNKAYCMDVARGFMKGD